MSASHVQKMTAAIGFSALLFTACGQDNKGILPGVNALLFVKRAYINAEGEHNVAGGAGQVFDYLRYEPGGGVFVLEPPTPDGKLRNLTEGFEEVDISGMDLSFDAKEVTFAMRRKGDDRYHIYVANIDGSGDVKQLTFGDADDVNPLYVPGNRIAFVTNEPYTPMGTRADEYNHSRVVTQIATVSKETGDADRRLCSQNLSHTADPFLMSDGSIGFSRWEHLGPVNDVKLFRMKPDCTNMLAVAGQHGKNFNSIVQTTELREGVFVGIATNRDRTIQAGALVQIDARARSGSAGIKYDEQTARFDILTPAVPTGEESPPSNVGRYRTPAAVPGSSDLLVAWANGDVNEKNEQAETAPDFGIYLWNSGSRSRTLIYDDPNTWDLYPTPVVARDIPPVDPGILQPQSTSTTPARIGSVNIALTSLDETVSGAQFDNHALSEALKQATAVRVIEGFSGEIGGGVGQFGLTMHEGAAILGEVPVQTDGSWEATIPPYLPYHLQPIDKFGMSIRNQLLWIQAMPGEERRCGGCHESRSQVVTAPPGGTIAQMAPQNLVKPIAQRQEIPWINARPDSALLLSTGETDIANLRNLQDLFNAKCASCHQEGAANNPFAGQSYMVTVPAMGTEPAQTFTIPFLDLSARTIAVEYEDEVVNYPASYVTLLYPSAMMGDSVVTGTMPPMWVQPGSARSSALIEAINVEVGGERAWANAGLHPENHGVTLTPAERRLLIQMADLGGQYWSRRNVEGGGTYNETDYTN